jgi:hypothetical protein
MLLSISLWWQALSVARSPPSVAGRGTLRSNLLRLELSTEPDDVDLERITYPASRQSSTMSPMNSSAMVFTTLSHVGPSTSFYIILPANTMSAQHEQLRKFDRTPQMRRRRDEGVVGAHVHWDSSFLRSLLRRNRRVGSAGGLRKCKAGHNPLYGEKSCVVPRLGIQDFSLATMT